MKIDIEQLGHRCLQSVGDLLNSEPGFQPWHLNKEYFSYRKTEGAKVLCVAHVDTVSDIPHHLVEFDAWGQDMVRSINLDDRLGVYVILDLLPTLLSEPIDVLLTDDEEVGRSTARHFTRLPDEEKKDYNWICSFDRRGTDVVMYDYHDSNTSNLMRKYGFEVGWGSVSDISYMTDLGVKGFNFGVGYNQEHSLACHAFLEDTVEQVTKFVTFFEEMKDTKLEHDESMVTKRRYYYGGGTGYSAHDWESDYQWYRNRYNGTGSSHYEYSSGDKRIECDLCTVEYSHWSVYYVDQFSANMCHNCMKELGLQVWKYRSVGSEYSHIGG